jgi:acyl-CoA dehydrogenase
MASFFFLMYFLFTLWVLYRAMPSLVWEIGTVVYLLVATWGIGLHWFAAILIWAILLTVLALVRSQGLRDLISDSLFQVAVKSVPKLSKTEEEALNAGDTWVEKDIFVGDIQWDKLSSIATQLTKEEQAFLENETQILCSMLDEWEIAQNQDLPPAVWDYIKEKGFLGLVIAKEYGGKGFSARAHSDVVIKIASRSGVAAVTVMVPNSLGPGELLQHYGTDEQKEKHLPRLAQGLDIPCFALTEPDAGSDATSIQSEAIVMNKTVDGKNVLGLMLSLNKRWITLSPVATLIGLAVRLKDPDGLLNGIGKEGITCLLIPRDIENLEIGARHLPANQPFMNGTIRGQGIFVPITSIIGGQEKAGCGWQMLVECLSIGRSISLPALGTASSSVAYLTTGAFARLRRQFNAEIAQFEGVEEKLAEIAGLNYMVSATRLLTVAAVNEHKKPSVASAITKYFNTELARIAINHAMDIHAGRAVVMGPRNYLASHYQSIPISVTVEGANIMSRNLLIFGQGSMACHPFIRKEFYAVAQNDKPAFRAVLWQHVHYFLQNFAKALSSSWTGGFFLATPAIKLKRDYQRLLRLSHAFAWLADLSLLCLGGELKRKERLSARLADGLSYLYIATAVFLHCKQQDEHEDELVHAKWALSYCYYHAQKSMLALTQNFPSRPLAWLMRVVLFPWGQSMAYPSDRLDHQLAQLMTKNNHYRDGIKKYLYLSGDAEQAIDRMEHAFQLILQQAENTQMKEMRRCPSGRLKKTLEEKVAKKELTKNDMETWLAAEKARWDAMQVDEFSFESMKDKHFASLTDKQPTPFDD